MKKVDVIVPILLLLFTIFVFIQTYYFGTASIWTSSGAGERYTTTAATWPRIVLVILGGLSLLLLIRNLLRKGSDQAREETTSGAFVCEVKTEEEYPKDIKRGAIFSILVIGYLSFMELFGFAIDTLLFGLACVYFMGRKEITPWKGYLLSLAISGTVIVIFYRVLYLPLPRGLWVFRDISEFIIF